MKITFEGQENLTSVNYIKSDQLTGKQVSKEACFPVSVVFGSSDDQMIPPMEDGKKHSLLAGAGRDAMLQESGALENYRIVMAHTMSGDDLRRAEEEGFDLANMNESDTVTILDKVKAEAAKGGTVIRGYNDDLDEDVLESEGNAGLEGMIRNALLGLDLPATEGNINDVKNAAGYALSLEKPGEGEIAYMIENGLGTTIRDFYVAQNAAPGRAAAINNIRDIDSPEMKYVKESMIEAGKVLPDAEDGYLRAEWLFEKNLPVTRENILKEKNITGIEFPVSEYDAVMASARAVANGLDAMSGNLSGDIDIYEKAALLEKRVFSEKAVERGDIAHQRMIQEIRLSMTAEVNVELIRSGFAIDTAPIEEMLNELKAIEQAVALKYFPETAGVGDYGDNAPGMGISSPMDAVSAYRLMNAVNTAVSELPSSPASSLGMFAGRIPAEIAFGEFERIALGEKDRLRKAGESYEALMTEVRPDLGDSMSKAFSNVDDIIKSLGLDLSDSNRRHVRILAYNRMELTVQNIDRISEADRLVTGVIEKMKPAAVLDMIRSGINPLEKDFEEINRFLDERAASSESYERASENYAEFLYALDKHKEITESERESYIGIYRMIDKIGKKDSAAVGAVVNTGAALDFSNLLTAVRSSRFKGMDIKVDENTGLGEIVSAGRSITAQIMTSFTENASGYYEDKAEMLRQAALLSPEGGALIESSGEEFTAENIIAAGNLLSTEDDLYRTFFDDKRKNRTQDLKAVAEEALETISESGDGAGEYVRMLENFRSAAEGFTFEEGTSLDVRAMQQVCRQISLAVSAVKSGAEEYFVPVEINGEISKIRLSFVRGENGSSVDITFSCGEGRTGRAHFDVEGDALKGSVYSNSEADIKNLQGTADIFVAGLRNRGLEAPEGISVAAVENIETIKNRTAGTEAGDNSTEGAGRMRLFGISKDFLKAVKESFYED